jgi:mannosyl-oligosaccharide alpha-1,2-mannosidase
MPMDGKHWMKVVDEWELGGRQGGVPPGMGEPEPEKDEIRRDYRSSYPNQWLLRPEVKKTFHSYL